jgi:predicted outer membrane repeat protein
MRNGGGISTTTGANLNISGNAKILDNHAAVGNYAAGSSAGGGIYMEGGAADARNKLTISDSALISGNTAGTRPTDQSSGSGGGIYTYYYTDLVIKDSVQITENEADRYGGGIYTFGTGVEPTNSTVDISGSVKIDSNKANMSGAGATFSGSVPVNISGQVEFTNNYAQFNGGGIFVQHGNLPNLDIAAGVKFSGNSAATYHPIDPADQPTYDAHVLAIQWSSGMTNGYNNYDIYYLATAAAPWPKPTTPSAPTPLTQIVKVHVADKPVPGAPSTGVGGISIAAFVVLGIAATGVIYFMIYRRSCQGRVRLAKSRKVVVPIIALAIVGATVVVLNVHAADWPSITIASDTPTADINVMKGGNSQTGQFSYMSNSDVEVTQYVKVDASMSSPDALKYFVVKGAADDVTEYVTWTAEPTQVKTAPAGQSTTTLHFTIAANNSAPAGDYLIALQVSSVDASPYAALQAKVLEYAWPDYHAPNPNYLDVTDAYATAISAHQAAGLYVGGVYNSQVIHPGIDCGGFVTILMQDSGYEPNYNYGGVPSQGAGTVWAGQKPWLDEQVTAGKWEYLGHITDESGLKVGDVAIRLTAAGNHTFVYIGNIAGFNSKIVSAGNGGSVDSGWLAPMASVGGVDRIDDQYTVWYRKKW